MTRYGAIDNVLFGETALGLPVSLRVNRRCDALALTGEAASFPASVQPGPAGMTIELHLRDLPAADALTLGQAAKLSFDLLPTADGQAVRHVEIDRAVLVGIQTHYRQDAPAEAVLTFSAESADGAADPFLGGTV